MTMMILSPRAQEIAEEIMASFERIYGLLQQLSPDEPAPPEETTPEEVPPEEALMEEALMEQALMEEAPIEETLMEEAPTEESLPHGIKRELRMSAADIRRINARTREEATRLPPDWAWLVNARVDQIEMNVELQEYRLSATNRTAALSQQFMAVLVEGIADVEAYAVEVFYALKRASRQPGREHLIPQVQELQRALRRLRVKKRSHPDGRQKAEN
jgi:hypothetical protein